jgi:VWFA-related protein
MRIGSFYFAFFLILAGGCNIFSQDYQVTVTTVNVWIKAVDSSGNPVSGLLKSDFEIFEDNKKVTPSCFEEVHLSIPAPDQSMDASRPENAAASTILEKRFILFLDLYNTTQVELERIRPQTDDFIRRIAKKNWKVMLVAYLPSGKLGIVSPFTQDMTRIRSLLGQAKGNPQRDQRIKRNESEILEMLAAVKIQRDSDAADSDENVGSGGAGGADAAQASHSSIIGGEEEMMRMAVNNAYRQAGHFARQEKQASEHAFAALETFSEYYSSKLSEGEHTIILFISGGINSDPGRRYYDVVTNFVTARAANVNPSDFALSVTGSTKENSFDLQTQIQKSVGKLNRSNMTMYAMNTRGLDSSGPDIARMEAEYSPLDTNTIKDYQDSLSQISEETGGFSFQNSQNFKIGFDNVLNDLSHQYLICYLSPSHKESGEYHKIKVVAKKPGLKLRYRQGYID